MRMVLPEDAMHHPTIDRPTLLRLAAAADSDPRSVARRLRGEHVRGRAGERIDRVLRARGLLPAVPVRRWQGSRPKGRPPFGCTPRGKTSFLKRTSSAVVTRR